MNELSRAIESAIRKVGLFGSSNVVIDSDKSIQGEWESVDGNSSYDMITIYILEDDVIKLRYQDKSSKILA